MKSDSRMLTIQQLADMTALSTRYIRLLIEAGKIPAYRFGKKKGLRVKLKDAKVFIESKKV